MDEESKDNNDIYSEILISKLDSWNNALSIWSFDNKSSFDEFSKIEIPNIAAQFILTKYWTKELKGISDI